jgi:uncharacterized membrane protein
MSMATQIVLVVAALLCSLVAGFLFAFAVVIMPGIRNLGDREFLRAFQAIDGVIQRGQPLFRFAWLGSVLTLVAGLALGAGQVPGPERLFLAIAGGVYLLGVQLPTVLVNIPLNNQVRALDLEEADAASCHSARERFEPRWNRWNAIRTALAVLASGMLVVFLTRF